MRLSEKALTFDDVLLLPAYSAVLPRDTHLSTLLTRNIALNLPLVSAAMDTVTESGLAITLAQEGGIGIIHKNMDYLIQAEHVRRVKKFESGVIKEPTTVPIIFPSPSISKLTRLSAFGTKLSLLSRKQLKPELEQ